MPTRPPIGEQGGQAYDVARAIRNFLRQMAEGRTRLAPAVIKELIQNADDAGADSMDVILDERVPPSGTPHEEYEDLCGPALIIRNNAPFEGSDFKAIRDVAGGHKRAQGTAAGRFGIGFNSVYFLTDTPVIFSRREVHIFDLLGKVVDPPGWKFPLDAFPVTSGTHVGPIKGVLEWILPKVALGGAQTFGEMASDAEADLRQAVFRLPLRRTAEEVEALYDDRFGGPLLRRQLLGEVIEQTARSLLFLKKLCTVSFAVLGEEGLSEVAQIYISRPPEGYVQFLNKVREHAKLLAPGDRLRSGSFRRTLDCWTTLAPTGETIERKDSSWSFEIRHEARFDDDDLLQLRRRLHLNNEKAVPWTSVAIPLTLESLRAEGKETPAWRVFLPLDEPGPCGCPLSAALFVGPSRRKCEFRLEGSDEAKRKTEWNRTLVRKGLLPLLQEATFDIPDLLRGLVTESPRDYLSLFPVAPAGADEPSSLAEDLQQCFSREPWRLRIFDIWGEDIDLMIDESGTLELIPEWLVKYSDRFRSLSTEDRRFVAFNVGDTVQKRLGDTSAVRVNRKVGSDVLELILAHDTPPNANDLDRLLKGYVDIGSLAAADLENLWCFQDLEDGSLLRFHKDHFYVSVGRVPTEGILSHLRKLGLDFVDTHWVKVDAGILSVLREHQEALGNIASAADSTSTGIELLRRVSPNFGHDSILHAREIAPVVDFLISVEPHKMPQDLHLAFLVRSAENKSRYRRAGSILIRPTDPSSDESAIWEMMFRRTFAEIHHEFAPEINRFLDHAPQSLPTLDDEGCRVVRPTVEESLRLLHEARVNDRDFIDRLIHEFDRRYKRSGDAQLQAEKAAALVVLEASRRWEEMSGEERATILALPIHRKPDGTHIPLADPATTDLPDLTSFRLQSDDDLRDAPIDVPEYSLLQSDDRAVSLFYRLKLGLEVHGRIAVLKDVLRQIGNDGVDSKKLLSYLAKYYVDTVEELEASNDPANQADGQELRKRMESARTVPCIDEQWRRARDCQDSARVAKALVAQGWDKKEIPKLLRGLFDGQPVVSNSSELRRLVRKLHEFNEAPIESIFSRAVLSESSHLTVEQRCRLVVDNWNNRSTVTSRAAILNNNVSVPTLAGERKLTQTVFVKDSLLARSALRHFYPAAVDDEAFARRFSICANDVPKVLAAFSVAQVSEESVKQTVIGKFSQTWPRLDDTARCDLLEYIGRRQLAGDLEQSAADLDVTLVRDPKVRWTKPTGIAAPKWLRYPTEMLADRQLPDTASLTESAKEVWDHWCGLKTPTQLLDVAIENAEALLVQHKHKATRNIFKWIESLHEDEEVPRTDVTAALSSTRWVFAKKGSEYRFRCPAAVLIHQGNAVLGQEFWVPAIPLPDFIAKEKSSYGFQTSPKACPDSIKRIASCLRASVDAKPGDVLPVYRMLRDLVGEDEVMKEQWCSIADDQPVFHLFRGVPDTVVTRKQLFLGDAKSLVDIGSSIFCLRAGEGVPKSAIELYRSIGVEEKATAAQALGALVRLQGQCKGQLRTFESLVNILRAGGDESFLDAQFQRICMPSCAGSFERIDKTYWDDEWGIPRRSSSECAQRLFDTSNRASRHLVEFLESNATGVVQYLRFHARPEICEEPARINIEGSEALLVGPWTGWFQELCRPDSTLRAKALDLGLSVPELPLELEVVERIPIRFVLPDDLVISPAKDWSGPDVEHDGESTVYLSKATVEKNYLGDPQAQDGLDRVIALRVAELLIRAEEPSRSRLQSASDFITGELERPSTLLERLRRTNQNHFFHQYYDQVADAEFAELFDEYGRTKPKAQRYEDLQVRMQEILTERFVKARRDQIRGHGYDEKSVFAELVQNAEDAYAQRSTLGMDKVKPAHVHFRYVDGNTRSLIVEHQGRPFNYWRHGNEEEPRFKFDVEGVLRSAGSYKPTHSEDEDSVGATTVGRFGLGFKSVFLLTNSPRIHSGQWHFEVESGCLPKPIAPPPDLATWDTRIVLPLLPEVRDLEDPNGKHLASLLPFLHSVTRLQIETAKCTTQVKLRIESSYSSPQGEHIVELARMDGVSHVPSNHLAFIRLRHADHSGQLGIYLAEDGTPCVWSDAFERDLYVALPLQTELGCGVGVSSLLEVQSGRTHLVESETNLTRFEEIAQLLRALPGAVGRLLPDTNLSDWYLRFWTIWHWDQGDAESKPLRRFLAKELVSLASSNEVVPTQSGGRPRRLGEGPLFYFTRIPDRIRDLAIRCGVPVDINGQSTDLNNDNVVPESFAAAFKRASRAAGHLEVDSKLHEVSWLVLGEGFKRTNLFAEDPEVFSEFAGYLPESQQDDVLPWLTNCEVRAVAEDGNLTPSSIANVLSYNAKGLELLPRRLVLVLDTAYNEAALKLLEKAGLLNGPSPAHIRDWLVQARLGLEQGIRLLRYLRHEDRFMWEEYRDLNFDLRQPCFQSDQGVVSAVQAVKDFGDTEEFADSPMFAAWLGLTPGTEVEPEADEEQAIDPAEALARLFEWWETNGTEWTKEYERRTYPSGSPPDLKSSYMDTTNERRSWLTLLLIASLGSLGRVRPEQNRNFLRMCEKRGWMKTFVDPRSTAQEWINVLEGYLDENSLTLEYYQWVAQFVRVFHLSRWLRVYVNQFLSINLRDHVSLRSLLSPNLDPALSGSGEVAPPLPLGVGTCFAIRELARLGVVENPNVYRYCYGSFRRARRIMVALDCEISENADIEASVVIYEFLREHLGSERATFGNSFDLPILALAEDSELQRIVFNRDIDFESEEES